MSDFRTLKFYHQLSDLLAVKYVLIRDLWLLYLNLQRFTFSCRDLMYNS